MFNSLQLFPHSYLPLFTLQITEDKLFENLDAENFRLVMSPKAKATLLLDHISRKVCPSLEYFVIFSSVSSGFGNTGQTNYGLANSICERICERRRACGFPALVIQWGAVDDVGMTKNSTNIEKICEYYGLCLTENLQTIVTFNFYFTIKIKLA